MSIIVNITFLVLSFQYTVAQTIAPTSKTTSISENPEYIAQSNQDKNDQFTIVVASTYAFIILAYILTVVHQRLNYYVKKASTNYDLRNGDITSSTRLLAPESHDVIKPMNTTATVASGSAKSFAVRPAMISDQIA